MLAEVLLFSSVGSLCYFTAPLPTAKEAWTNADAVVLAVIESREMNDKDAREPYRFTARAYEAFKGAAEGDAFQFEGGITTCGGSFQVGEQWLFYLGRRSGGLWGVSRRRNQAHRAGEDVRLLRALPDAAKVSRIAGTVRQDGEPVSNIVVTASDGSRELATVTDLDGTYEFVAVPPGAWQVSAAPGGGWRPHGARLGKPGESGAEIRGAEHVQVDFTLKPSGRIAGVLRDAAGQGVYGASVSLRMTGGRSREARTDRNGGFAFDELEAGEYQVVANVVGAVPAGVVRLSKGQRLEGLEVPAGPMPKRIVITGRV